jgi:hypothetical protein
MISFDVVKYQTKHGDLEFAVDKKIYIDSNYVVCVLPFRNVSTAVMLDNGHTVFVEQDVYEVLDAIALEKGQCNQNPCSSSESK